MDASITRPITRRKTGSGASEATDRTDLLVLGLRDSEPVTTLERARTTTWKSIASPVIFGLF